MTPDEVKQSITGWCTSDDDLEIGSDRFEPGTDFSFGLKAGTLSTAPVDLVVLKADGADRVTIRRSVTLTGDDVDAANALVASRPGVRDRVGRALRLGHHDRRADLRLPRRTEQAHLRPGGRGARAHEHVARRHRRRGDGSRKSTRKQRPLPPTPSTRIRSRIRPPSTTSRRHRRRWSRRRPRPRLRSTFQQPVTPEPAVGARSRPGHAAAADAELHAATGSQAQPVQPAYTPQPYQAQPVPGTACAGAAGAAAAPRRVDGRRAIPFRRRDCARGALLIRRVRWSPTLRPACRFRSPKCAERGPG